MGWEWHDRQRDGQGKFARGWRTEQLHLYCYPKEIEAVRLAATATAQDISTFCRRAILAECARIAAQRAQKR